MDHPIVLRISSLLLPKNRRTRIASASVVFCLVALFLVSLSSRTHSNINTFPRLDPVDASTPRLFELQGIKLGREFLVSESQDDEEQQEAIHQVENDTLSKIKSELLRRFGDLEVDTSHPDCVIDLARFKRSGLLSTSRAAPDERISLALDLFNVQEVLPSLSLALIELIYYLRPHHQVYISIYENGSYDKTIDMLGELAAALVALKVDGLWFRHSYLVRTYTDRILSLANLRNEALFPLLPFAAGGILLFINDVVTCGADLLELPHQLRLQNSHGVFSVDWGVRDEFNKTQGRIYDFWVARGINGQLPYPWKRPAGFNPMSPNEDWVLDFWMTQEKAIHDRWLEGRPFPVYAGWNGAVALQSSFFTRDHLRFRASMKAGWQGGDDSGVLGKWGRLLATPGYLESDCAASECSLFMRDIWNLMDGQARFVLAPQSRTAYHLGDWNDIKDQVPPVRRSGADNSLEELIDWWGVVAPETVVCIPTYRDDGSPVEVWDEDNFRKDLSAFSA